VKKGRPAKSQSKSSEKKPEKKPEREEKKKIGKSKPQTEEKENVVKPSRAIGAYIYFVTETTNKLKQENPGMSHRVAF